MKSHEGQTRRILQRLLHGDEVPAVELHRIGSGKELGFVASISRRISDVRDMGWNVVCRREVVAGQTHTFYQLFNP